MVQATHYEKIGKNRVRCLLCAHMCVIAEGRVGVCGVRKNQNGDLYTSTYGSLIARHVDPIEKKPLYHFLPGSKSYSIATPGCNFQCPWCQNWEIAQMPRLGQIVSGEPFSPAEIVASALATRSESIAYTYTEPSIFFEYAFDTGWIAKEAGLANIFVTNGYMSAKMLKNLLPILDAANVDLKAFNRRTYNRVVKARLDPILDNLRLMKKNGVWLEVTTLVIPGLNDGSDELRGIAQFLAQELGVDTPWHISRFFPAYQMVDRPPTPLGTLRKAKEIGHAEGLQYVYMGNVTGDDSDTHCPNCHTLLIERTGYWVRKHTLAAGSCPHCETAIPGVWR
jgi:pyruvate formate lyase activating enzyme